MGGLQDAVVGQVQRGLWKASVPIAADQETKGLTREAALKTAKQRQGAELVAEVARNGSLSYDVFNLSAESSRRLATGADLKTAMVDSDAVKRLEGGADLRESFFVAADGTVGVSQEPRQFKATLFDRAQRTFDFEDNPVYRKVVDKVFDSSKPDNGIPKLTVSQIEQMRQHLKPGDALLNGNNGSFIHGIVYVGQDADLQAQLERKWNLPAGSLHDQGIIIHALASDHPAVINGVTLPEAGTGVVLDTLESFVQRHPRDLMVAMSPTRMTDADRRAVVAAAKAEIGKPYDYVFDPTDESRMYCTKLVEHSLESVANAPRIDRQLFPLASIPGTNKGVLPQEMVMNDGLLMSPDMQIAWASPYVEKLQPFHKYEDIAAKYQAHDPTIMRTMPGVASMAGRRIEELRQASRLTEAELVKPAS